MKLFGNGRSLIVAVYDGLAWRAYAMRQARGEWTCDGRTEEAARGGRQVPKALIDFVAQSGAKRMRVLLAGDVHALDAHELISTLPEDATDEELHTALAYEAQGEAGLEAEGHRLAAARADLYEMGGERTALLAASFEIDQMERFASDAEAEGVRFEGAGSLELAILAEHARRTPNRRLLLVRERTSFYAVPANDPQPFLTAALPLGLDAATDPTAKERAGRARERLSLHDAVPMTVILCGAGEHLRKRMAPYLGACADVDYLELRDIEEDALCAAAGGRVGGVMEVCPWIGLPPPPRDPHRYGTVLLFIILAVALGWVGISKHDMTKDLCVMRAKLTAWESLEGERKKAASKTQALRDRQNAVLQKKALLESRRCLPHGLLPLLQTLAERMPAYSCLLSVKQRSDAAGFDVVGLTRWQDGLPQLDAALRDMGERAGMRREFGGLESVEGRHAQHFKFTVSPREKRL